MTRTPKKPITWAMYALICEQLAQGVSVTRIAPMVGMSVTVLHIKLRALGLVPPAKPRPWIRGLQDQKRIQAQAQEKRRGHQFKLLDDAWRKAA